MNSYVAGLLKSMMVVIILITFVLSGGTGSHAIPSRLETVVEAVAASVSVPPVVVLVLLFLYACRDRLFATVDGRE